MAVKKCINADPEGKKKKMSEQLVNWKATIRNERENEEESETKSGTMHNAKERRSLLNFYYTSKGISFLEKSARRRTFTAVLYIYFF